MRAKEKEASVRNSNGEIDGRRDGGRRRRKDSGTADEGKRGAFQDGVEGHLHMGKKCLSAGRTSLVGGGK